MLSLTFCLFANALVYAVAAPRTSTQAALQDQEAGTFDCILVLGAGLTKEGTPGLMLSDRLNTAISLFQAGFSEKILVSGDRREGYDEVTAMRRYLLQAGIDGSAIIEDGNGYSTHESMENLKESNEAFCVLIVTQAYHLPRALFLATVHGLDATGIAAEEKRYKGQTYRDVREFAACVKDVLLAWL